MSDRIIKLLLVDRDPVFRTGLRVVIEQYSDLQVAAEAETSAEALQILAEMTSLAPTTPGISSGVVIVVLDLVFEPVQPNQLLGLELCRQLKNFAPGLPILLLSSLRDPDQIAAARATGVNGYCPKGIPVSELVAAVRQVAAGRSYWVELEVRSQESSVISSENEQLIYAAADHSILAIIGERLRLSGLQHIDATLMEVTAQLQIPGLSILEQAVLAGQRRELLAARWVVNHLLSTPSSRSLKVGESQERDSRGKFSRQAWQADNIVRLNRTGARNESSELTPTADSIPTAAIAQRDTSPQTIRTIQSALFASTLEKLQLSLENRTRVPLEIDIFRVEKKRELLYLILRKFEAILDELRFSQVQPSQLPEMRATVLRDLWQAAVTDFFGKYSTLRVGKANLEVVNVLLQDTAVVQTEILDKIPLVVELFSYLLFETPLVIDNVAYSVNSPEAIERAEVIFQNLLIQLACGVIQPLLNRFADVEIIKQSFYDRQLISTREIERFRNNLSWKYRLINYVEEPTAIFESRYELFILASRGLAKISIYAPRRQELAQLSGIRLAVTLALETRDAIAPRLRAVVAFLGSGVVYVLTQVIGRAIGLIGRGILQGIGGSLPEGRNKRF